MPLPVPNLDDLDFEGLVEQARGFIPRYAPDWTDHNIHDPGVTLLDLAAWLVDQQIYRVGFVSDRHIKAFAALLGVYSESATPSHGLVWPQDNAINDTGPVNSVNLDAGAKITCVEQPEVPFELAASVYISLAQFAGKAEEEKPAQFRITASTKSRRAAPILKDVNGKPGVVELIFDRPLVHSGDADSNHPISVGFELESGAGTLSLTQSPGGRLVADYRLEQAGIPWRRATIVEDNTYALNQTGVVLLKLPPETQDSETETTVSRLRLYVEGRINPVPPRIKRAALNVLPVVQHETVPQSVIGRSNGQPDQTFILNLESLPAGEEIIIEVVEDGQFIAWHRIDDLAAMGPWDGVFELFPEKNQIRFGNGVNGRVPPNDAQIQHLNYRLTAGAAGNLRTELNWVVRGAPTRSGQSSYGLNYTPFHGGADAWDMERLIAEARQAALERNALLTNAELEDAAETLEGMAVERANVLVGFNPALPVRETNNARALVITPERSEDVDPLTPVPRRYLTAIERALEPRRVLGERLSILLARRVPVAIQALILIKDGTDANLVIEEAEARLKARLSDMEVENDTNVEPWPVGRDVTRQEIKALLAGVDGVVAVTQCRIESEDRDLREGDLPLQRDEIAIGIDFNISVELNAATRR